MFNFIKKLFGKEKESPQTTNWIPKMLKAKEIFADAGMSAAVQRKSARNKRREQIAKHSRKINYRWAKTH